MKADFIEEAFENTLLDDEFVEGLLNVEVPDGASVISGDKVSLSNLYSTVSYNVVAVQPDGDRKSSWF